MSTVAEELARVELPPSLAVPALDDTNSTVSAAFLVEGKRLFAQAAFNEPGALLMDSGTLNTVVNGLTSEWADVQKYRAAAGGELDLLFGMKVMETNLWVREDLPMGRVLMPRPYLRIVPKDFLSFEWHLGIETTPLNGGWQPWRRANRTAKGFEIGEACQVLKKQGSSLKLVLERW